jgi:phosphoribosylcarboxyaminoimidazole (NCAIR) mutase
LAAQILALSDRDLRGRLDDRRTLQTEAARASAPRLSFDLERPAFEAKT